MYNLDVNLASAAAATSALNNLLAVETGGATPRTPEILNSLMAMTNPLDIYNFGDDAPKQAKNSMHSRPFTSASSDSNSSSCSQVESPTNGPNSVQQTCSQLIKAGLKLTIEQKRKHQSDSDDILDLDKCKRVKKHECSESEEDKINNSGWFSNYFVPSTNEAKSSRVSRTSSDWQDLENYEHYRKRKLTPEDEERRRRRRERNKIAATKCRLKKRERTANLVIESETLEKQNVDLKAQIQALQNEQMNLNSMLQTHRSACQKNIPRATRDAIYNHRLPSLSAITNNHSYNRPSPDGNYRTHPQNLEIFNRPNSADVTFSRPLNQFGKTPTIVVDSPTENFQSHITNLDAPSSQNVYHHNSYNNQQCHNYNTGQGYGNNGLDNGCMA